MVKIVLIQGSLSKKSKTSIVLEKAAEILEKKGVSYEMLDLRKLNMEFCDGRPLEEYNNDMQKAYHILKSADAYIIGMPVYQYSVSGPLKNFLDIVSGAMKRKIAGIVCVSGGTRSYLASQDLMKILSFEVHVVSVQPTVHASKEDFDGQQIVNPKIIEKIEGMVDSILRFV